MSSLTLLVPMTQEDAGSPLVILIQILVPSSFMFVVFVTPSCLVSNLRMPQNIVPWQQLNIFLDQSDTGIGSEKQTNFNKDSSEKRTLREKSTTNSQIAHRAGTIQLTQFKPGGGQNHIQVIYLHIRSYIQI